ncbi:extracellular solute-binding protein [Leifsonia kafniensis]|uniref:Extracellular solute-binding protein n=1 Tax=Leifsonia kafniensis TaxID=475957 RepID=A0ABP7K2D6_9MICO
MHSTSRVVPAVAASAVLMLALAGCGSSATPSSAPTSIPDSMDAAGEKVTVWVMQDDYSQDTLDAINTTFTKRTGAKADVQIQQWDGITTKLSTALSTNNPPDVVDIGNTQVAGYADGGALMDITKYRDQLEQGQTWLDGLVDPATVDGSLYAVPGFAGARSVIYNKKTWAEAGITTVPTTWDELTADLDQVKAANTASDFSALYLPGQHWYVGMQFVWDADGEIAVDTDGIWTGELGSAKAQDGLAAWKEFQNTYSAAASRTLSTDSPEQEQIFADGKASAIVASNGAVDVILGANPSLTADDLGTFALPGQSGKTQPVMLGGSDWGIAAKSSNQELALVWTQIAASPEIQNDYVFGVSGWIPNSTEGIEAAQATLSDSKVGFFQAALNSRATPASPGWSGIEGSNALQELFSSVANGSATTKAAAATFDAVVDSALK